MRKKERQKGFTLTEVMVVVAIISVLAIVAIPSVLSFRPNMWLRSTARDVYSGMLKAKMVAIKTNTPSTLNFVTSVPPACTGGSFSFTNGSADASDNANITINNGVCLSTPSSYPVGFSPSGLPTGATGSVTFTHPQVNKSYTITQSLAGGIRFIDSVAD